MAENFDEQFKQLKVALTPLTADGNMILKNLCGNEFNGFSWTNSNFYGGEEEEEAELRNSVRTTATTKGSYTYF